MIDQAAGLDQFTLRSEKFSLKFGGRILTEPSQATASETFDPFPEKRNDTWVTDVVADFMVDIDRRTEFLSKTSLLDFHSINSPNISDEHLVLLTPRLYGYAMRARKWLAFNVELLDDLVDHYENPMHLRTRYEDLILPKGHKKLLQALVSYYTRDRGIKPSLDDIARYSLDVVAGKGEGLIILLHGPPGVGKTSTAECVAAQLRRPLLPITCGDLGDGTEKLEANLEAFCRLASKWRCVLLLDEADVFLTKREKGDHWRNATVGGKQRVVLI
jgi:ATPase family associated with various cellular activities (AAA)